MNYITADAYANYGLEDSTPASLVASASALIEAYCRRPTLGVAQYTERLRPSSGTLELSYLPLSTQIGSTGPITAARARCARREQDLCMSSLSDSLSVLVTPGSWVTLDPSNFDVMLTTGEVTMPSGMLSPIYDEVELTYYAGWATPPEAVMQACAMIVRNAQATPATNVSMTEASRMRMEYFSDSLLDADVKRLLAPFVAQRVG